MISPSTTLFRYISRLFLTHLVVLMLILQGIMLLLNVIEDLRRSAGGDHQTPFGLVFSMSLMKLPYLSEVVLPMGILFTAIYTCWKLNKTSELVVMRSSGLSAWQFLSPLIACAVLTGILATTILNPVSAIFLNRHEQLERNYFNSDKNLVTVSKTGIWLRQPTELGYALIHSDGFDQEEWRLNKVIVLYFDKDDNFVQRMDSPTVYLRDKHWEIQNPLVSDKNGGVQQAERYQLPTELTSSKIEESFADPKTISFWSIPGYIGIMEDTGFPATRIYLRFHQLLAQPFLFMAMILLAATFSLRPPRQGGVVLLVAMGVAVGFFTFFMQSFLQAFGVSGKVSVPLAAWSPAVIGLLLGGTALLHLEDG